MSDSVGLDSNLNLEQTTTVEDVPEPQGMENQQMVASVGQTVAVVGGGRNLDNNQLLEVVVSRKASDLHIVVGSPLMLRIHGELIPLEGGPVTPDRAKDLVLGLMDDEQRKFFEKNKELDFSYQLGDKARFRINAYFQKGNMSAALRMLSNEILSIDELKLPSVCHQITQLKQGFVLVTGPTGSGKSTTLAAMVDEINRSRSEHIVTIEDPIEYLHLPKKSIISQREMLHDTLTWANSLKSVLREDPNVVLVGEMRDYETIAAALTVAETGHLVFATLHTNSAAQTIDRIIDVFPEEQQAQVRNQLALSIEAVFAQRLVPAVNGGRVPALEVLLASSAVRSSIREGKTYQIDNVIQTSGALGMMPLETSLVYWVKSGVVTLEKAREFAIRPEELMRLLKKE